MEFKQLKIRGTYLVEPKIYEDNRGLFFESFNNKSLKKIIKKKNFIQANHSYSKKNVLRGIHFQIKRPQFQLFYLVKGQLDVFLVDFRPKSKTFLQNIYINLKSETFNQILTSPGIGTGFYAKSKENIVKYFVTEYYNKSNECGILWNDKSLNIKWNCKKPILSKKDQENLEIKNVDFNKYRELNNIKI